MEVIHLDGFDVVIYDVCVRDDLPWWLKLICI